MAEQPWAHMVWRPLFVLVAGYFVLVTAMRWLWIVPVLEAHATTENFPELTPLETKKRRGWRNAEGDPAAPLCAVGDIHGDLDHGLRALRLCGAVDENGAWIGGRMTVVQTGDVVDRGNASIPCLHMLWRLRREAAAAGGELKLLIGNHELMNMQGRIFYVEGFARFGGGGGGVVPGSELAAAGGPRAWRARFDPREGDLGQRVASQSGAAIRGSGACRTLFVHAGLRARDALSYGSVGALNEALYAQLREGPGDDRLLDATEGPLWFRGYARPHTSGMDERRACKELHKALDAVGDGSRRMVVGHNIVHASGALLQSQHQGSR